MGSCLSSIKLIVSNPQPPNHAPPPKNYCRKEAPKTITMMTTTGHNRKNNVDANAKPPVHQHRPRRSEAVPCGKRTNFGYPRDFDQNYVIGKLLGHGQFGFTYVATDKTTGDRVAVKKIDKNKMIRPIAVEDVKREVKILQELKGHENVVEFYNVFEDEDFVYIAMELCEGGELLDRILAKKESRYCEKDAAVIVRQMLKVAAECHLHGLVHRDMKPENFLFKSNTDE